MQPIIFDPNKKQGADFLASKLLRLYMQALAFVAFLLGIFAWIVIFDLFEEPAWQFSSMSKIERAEVIFIAFGALIVATGLVQQMAWGLVAWLFCSAVIIFVGLKDGVPLVSGMMVAGIALALLIVYAILVILEEWSRRRVTEEQDSFHDSESGEEPLHAIPETIRES